MPRKKITPKEFSEVATGVRLSSHEKLCAERMNNILKSIDEMKREIKSLRQDVVYAGALRRFPPEIGLDAVPSHAAGA